MRRSTILKALMLMVLASFVTMTGMAYASDVKAEIYRGQFVFNGKTVTNKDLYYPMIKINNKVYYPVSDLDLTALGLKIQRNDAGRIDLMTTGDGRPSKDSIDRGRDVVNSASMTNIHVAFKDKGVTSSENGAVSCLNTVYMPFDEKTFVTLGWAYKKSDQLGYVLDSRGVAQVNAYLEKNDNKTDKALALYVMKINGNVSQSNAKRYVSIVTRSADKYKVDRIWVMAMIWQESRFNEKSVGGAYGMMQMTEFTGRNMGLTKAQLLQAELNIDVGVRYLKGMKDYYKGDLKKATLAYNQGSGRVNRGTHRTWYLSDVNDKYAKIVNFVNSNSQ